MKDGYILNFFADSVDDIQEISNGKKFVTMNGTDYGIPLDSSTIVITMPDKTKQTYVLSGGEWIMNPGIDSVFDPVAQDEFSAYIPGFDTIRAIKEMSGTHIIGAKHDEKTGFTTSQEAFEVGSDIYMFAGGQYPLPGELYLISLLDINQESIFSDLSGSELGLYPPTMYICKVLKFSHAEFGEVYVLVNHDCLLETYDEFEKLLAYATGQSTDYDDRYTSAEFVYCYGPDGVMLPSWSSTGFITRNSILNSMTFTISRIK